MARAQPFLRASLFPFADFWSGGPGLLCSFSRFGLWASFPVRLTAPSGGAAPRTVQLALLTPEVPYSVLPFSLRDTVGISCDLTLPETWRGHPIPHWRGVPCQIGTVEMFLSDEAQGTAVPFMLQALLPERDPAGPRPESVFLGEQFVQHYDLRLTFNYAAIRYLPQLPGGRRRLDSTARCGSLQMF